MANTYYWAVGDAGTWSDSANWFNLLTNTTAAVPPGPNDIAIINTGTVTGTGSSASLTLEGSDNIIGDLNTGTLVTTPYYYAIYPAYSPVTIASGGTIDAGAASINGALFVSGGSAALLVDGPLQLASEIAVINGGSVRATDLVTEFNANISVDSVSFFRVGSAGTGVIGALTIDQGSTLYAATGTYGVDATINANVVDDGLIDAAALSLESGALSGTGTVTVTQGGHITVSDSVASSALSFELNGDATLFADSAFTPGNFIAMTGSANVLDLVSAAFMNAATLTGFNATDTLAVDAVVTGDIYTPGTLTLLNGDSIVAVVNLAGDYADQSFQAVQQSPSLTAIFVIPGSGAPSAGTATQHSYVWIGSATGFWQVASNWEDVTAGQNPAVVAPGSLDIVTINGSVTVNGVGRAASLNILGTVSVTGDLNVGTLIAGTSDALNINTGGTISAAIASDAGSIIVNGASADLLVSGTLGIDTTVLTVSDGGVVQAGSVNLQGASPNTGFNVADTLSTVKVGNAGTASTGTLTIETGQTVSGTGGLSQPDTGPQQAQGWYPGTLDPVGYPIINNGLIVGAALQIGAIYSADITVSEVLPRNGGTFIYYLFRADIAGSLAGTGAVEVETGGTINVLTPVAGSETFRLEGSAEANFYNTLSSGNVILMDGESNTVTIGTTFNGIEIGGTYSDVGLQSLVNSNTNLPDLAGTIYGFGASDTIDLKGQSFTSAFDRNGVLNLLSGLNTEYSIAIGGDYTGDVFDVFGSIVTLTPGGLDGTSTGQTFSWIGPSGGIWGSSSNWADVTTGQSPSVIAPGSLDVVSISDAIIVGNGDAASATFAGTDTLVGDFQFGTLDVTDQGNLTIDNAAVGIAGALQVTGALNVVNGATVQTGTLELGSSNGANTIGVDATSVIEVGNLGSAAAGALTIDPGNTISGADALLGDVVDNGVIVGTNLTVGPDTNYFDVVTQFNLSGTGRVEALTGGAVTIAETVATAGLTFQLDGSADLTTFSTIGADNTVELVGSVNTITLVEGRDEVYLPGSIPAVGATIEGFNNTDTVVVPRTDPLTGSPIVSATWADGTLSLSTGTTTVTTMNLAGNYADDSFSVAPINVGDKAAITLTVPCFAAGTRIATPRGAIPVEDLREGDFVLTAFEKQQPIRWIGRRSIDCRRHPAPEQVWPVRIQASAMGAAPERDLLLSPDHAVFTGNVLVPVKHLINDTTIAQIPTGFVTYYHIELPSHDLLLVEGVRAESYLDTGDRRAFVNASCVVDLHPNLTLSERCEAIWEAAACAPIRLSATPDGSIETDLSQLVDAAWYRASNPDVTAAGVDPIHHYIQWGFREGREPCNEADLLRALGLVDSGTVVFTMADVVSAGLDPVHHFCDFGWRERRRPNPYFDTHWYLCQNDIPAGMNPLLHYILSGEPRGLRPSPHFDPAWYHEHYQLDANISPLAHYLMNRRAQTHSPLPSFNVEAYARAHRGSLRLHRDPYMHFLAAQSLSLVSGSLPEPAHVRQRGTWIGHAGASTPTPAWGQRVRA